MAVDLSAGSRFGGYDIEGLIGRGGMGVVHNATHAAHGQVALKLIRPELASDALFRARFERETRLAAEIDHPNVIPVYEAGEWEERLFLAMRYVEGIDLGSRIALEGRLHSRDAAPIVAQIASALDAAHARGLVHRDVKPGNVLIEAGVAVPHAYLTDFGLSRMVSSQSGLTRTGSWVGTTAYAAPEQLEAQHTDARTDVYGLGCLVYESLAGKVPFQKSREVQVLIAHLTEPPPSLLEGAPDSPGRQQLDAVIARAMAKAPEDRYQSAGELAKELLAAAELTPVPAPGFARSGETERGTGSSPVDRAAPTAG